MTVVVNEVGEGMGKVRVSVSETREGFVEVRESLVEYGTAWCDLPPYTVVDVQYVL